MGMLKEYGDDIRFTLDANPDAGFTKKLLLGALSIFFTHGERVVTARALDTPLAGPPVERAWDADSVTPEEFDLIMAEHYRKQGTRTQGEIDASVRAIDES